MPFPILLSRTSTFSLCVLLNKILASTAFLKKAFIEPKMPAQKKAGLGDDVQTTGSTASGKRRASPSPRSLQGFYASGRGRAEEEESRLQEFSGAWAQAGRRSAQLGVGVGWRGHHREQPWGIRSQAAAEAACGSSHLDANAGSGAQAGAVHPCSLCSPRGTSEPLLVTPLALCPLRDSGHALSCSSSLGIKLRHRVSPGRCCVCFATSIRDAPSRSGAGWAFPRRVCDI